MSHATVLLIKLKQSISADIKWHSVIIYISPSNIPITPVNAIPFFFLCSTKCCSIFLLMSVSIQPVKCLPALGPVGPTGRCFQRVNICFEKIMRNYEALDPDTHTHLLLIICQDSEWLWRRTESLKHLTPSQRRVLHLGTRLYTVYIYIDALQSFGKFYFLLWCTFFWIKKLRQVQEQEEIFANGEK